MAMNGNTLGDSIANIITASDAPEDVKQQIKTLWESIGSAIVDHIKKNAVISVPSGQVVTAVSGQATGTMNPSPINCSVS